jgi:excisionase family DNA binding protein
MQRETTPEQLQPLLTIPAVAKLLGVSRPTVYQLIDNDGLPVVKPRKARRVLPASLQSWLSEREQQGRGD